MRAVALLVLITLSGCGLFGDRETRSVDVQAQQISDPAQTDLRAIIPVITSARLDSVRGGYVLHASGVAPTQGYFLVEFIPENFERPVNATLIYQLRALPPLTPAGTGPESARTVTAARKIGLDQLSGVSRILVRGTQNQIEVRPR
ncbi:MAG: hypothetical protein AAGF74_17550 [Pseudomonadota bacterium]